jgi:catalase (peroxidase I)
VNGQCERPLGSTTVGLIYLNPEGPVVEAGGSPVPDPSLSVKDIRDSFARMDHDDRGTVALIGGGHAFGKSHGACPKGPGLRPSEAYAQGQKEAWQGECGEGEMKGKGANAFTAGFEGPWTTQPLQWDNEYFKKLLDREWEKFMGPGGHWQWRIKNAPEAEKGLMRLTSDMALLHDDTYLQSVKEFASDMSAFDKAFDKAWFKLTHSGGRWSPEAKCDTGSLPSWVFEQQYSRMLDTDAVLV